MLVACASPWQAPRLRRQFKARNTTVSLAGSTRREAPRLCIELFDVLIVDEGQDLLDMDVVNSLDAVLRGGLADGRWCLFHDVNNHPGLIGAGDADALAPPLSCRPAGPRSTPDVATNVTMNRPRAPPTVIHRPSKGGRQ